MYGSCIDFLHVTLQTLLNLGNQPPLFFKILDLHLNASIILTLQKAGAAADPAAKKAKTDGALAMLDAKTEAENGRVNLYDFTLFAALFIYATNTGIGDFSAFENI